MMERPSRSSSLARVKTASAPSPVSCETRDAMRSMVRFPEPRTNRWNGTTRGKGYAKPACNKKGAPKRPSDSRSKDSQLGGVTQRELNEPRRADSGDDFAECRGIFHIGDGWIREVGVVPKVEEVRGEPELLALGELEVPVLLVRSAVDIAAEVSEKSNHAISAIRQRKDGGCREIGQVQIAVVDAVVNIAARLTRGNGTARSKLS